MGDFNSVTKSFYFWCKVFGQKWNLNPIAVDSVSTQTCWLSFCYNMLVLWGCGGLWPIALRPTDFWPMSVWPTSHIIQVDWQTSLTDPSKSINKTWFDQHTNLTDRLIKTCLIDTISHSWPNLAFGEGSPSLLGATFKEAMLG